MRDFTLQPARILIIDDEAAMVEVLRRSLESHGYREIESTSDPFAAIGLFGAFEPDLVILDLLMPGLSGLDVLAGLRAIVPPETYLPILVLTGDPAIKTRREALSRGASDFLGKPYDAIEILVRIENLLETRFLHLQLAAKQKDLEAANEELRLEIRERSQAEEALRESEEHLRFTLGATDVGEWDLDLVTGATRRSLRHDQIFGYDSILPEWNREIFLHRHVHPDDRGRVVQALDAGMETGLCWEFECRIFRLDGEERFIWVKGATLGRTARRPKMSGVIMDVTPRKRIENELQLRAAKVAALTLLGHRALVVRALPEFFDETVLLIAETLGFECSQILELQPGGHSMLLRAGAGWKDGLVGHAVVEANEESQAGYTLHTGKPVTVEDFGAETRFRATPLLREHGIISGISVIIGHGDRPFGVLGAHSTSPRVFTEDHVHFLQAIANLLAAVVERTAVEETLREARASAERANAAKSEFLSRMSHELRTPLNAIVGFGQLLERDGRDPEEADNIGQILEAGRHLLELVNAMLDISDMEAERDLTIDSFPVSEAIEEALAMARPLAAEREVALGNLVCDRRVLIDRQRFKQVVFNLLSDTIKCNPRGGRITLLAEDTGGGWLRLAITDNGLGIAAADVSKILLAFERQGVAGRVDGIGLGLAISKRLVELMGCRIGVESVVGEGSCFWIEVPLAGNRVAALDQSASASIRDPQFETQKPRTLLYMEENLSNLRLITRILARRPAVHLLSAEPCALGLEAAREHLPDLILMDLHLPDSHGDQMLALLRADPRTSDIPVVMLGADDPPGKREQMLSSGARAFLAKPVAVRTLLGALDRFIEQRP